MVILAFMLWVALSISRDRLDFYVEWELCASYTGNAGKSTRSCWKPGLSWPSWRYIEKCIQMTTYQDDIWTWNTQIQINEVQSLKGPFCLLWQLYPSNEPQHGTKELLQWSIMILAHANHHLTKQYWGTGTAQARDFSQKSSCAMPHTHRSEELFLADFMYWRRRRGAAPTKKCRKNFPQRVGRVLLPVHTDSTKFFSLRLGQ